jgi:hypothetical protein
MAQNVTPFRWSEAKAEAAALLAEDALTDEEIADRVGNTRMQLARWKRHPEFAARVARLADDLGAIAARQAIGRRARRVRALQERHEKMLAVIEARALEHAGVPGGSTGLLVRTVRGIAGVAVDFYEVDTALLRELREHEKQAAQELGQWVERKETRDVTDDELDGEIRKLLGAVERNGQAPPSGQTPRAATP